jgi:sulfur carrier protein
MQIQLNGKIYAAQSAETVADLLEELQLAGQRVAVMVNGVIVKKERRAETPVSENDTVEIIGMVGGG